MFPILLLAKPFLSACCRVLCIKSPYSTTALYPLSWLERFAWMVQIPTSISTGNPQRQFFMHIPRMHRFSPGTCNSPFPALLKCWIVKAKVVKNFHHPQPRSSFPVSCISLFKVLYPHQPGSQSWGYRKQIRLGSSKQHLLSHHACRELLSKHFCHSFDLRWTEPRDSQTVPRRYTWKCCLLYTPSTCGRY